VEWVRHVRHIDDTCDLNRTDAVGWSAIMYAARHGHADIVEILQAEGADVCGARELVIKHRSLITRFDSVARVLQVQEVVIPHITPPPIDSVARDQVQKPLDSPGDDTPDGEMDVVLGCAAQQRRTPSAGVIYVFTYPHLTPMVVLSVR
jgi:hypothetical protein